MKLILDASMALAWHLERVNKDEAVLAQKTLQSVTIHGAVVPALWYSEVANGLLIAERNGVTTERESAVFQADVAQIEILMDSASPEATLPRVLAVGRSSRLSAYDAAYLELALRTGGTLATFDRQLAKAVRKAGGRVFGDPA